LPGERESGEDYAVAGVIADIACAIAILEGETMGLMKQIREYRVEKGSVAIWWLGQNGFIFKSPEGTLASVDLYLTDSCATLRTDIDLHRAVPILITPEELEVDIFTCTHNHQDHTDPYTIRALHHKDTTHFVGPIPTCEVYAAEGIEQSRIVRAWPKSEYEECDFRTIGTFALPTDDTDLNHMGFIFQFGHGPKIYITGDTDFHELLGAAGKHEPDMMITCINGGFNNLSHWEAAQVVGMVKPKVAVPCHYDMFADNRVDPQQFRAQLAIQGVSAKYQELEHGKPFIFSR
jgi:L-ascorbate 6-phosphate lactonase